MTRSGITKIRKLSLKNAITRIPVLVSLLAMAFLAGCGSQAIDPAVPRIRIAAASDLQAALPAVIERFRAVQKETVEVEPVFGSSGQLAKQIGQGGPFDLFLSANRAFVADLASSGAVERASVAPYSRGVLVLVVNEASKVDVKGLADLAGPGVKKIAIANPTFAPYGIAAAQAIERSKLTEAVAPKFVQADSVRHAFQFVQTGNAEAGLVAYSVALAPGVRAIPVDPSLYDPIDQYLGIVARSENKKPASAFADFLRGEEGQAVLKRFGFLRTEASLSSSGASQ